jgi:MFS family permease
MKPIPTPENNRRLIAVFCLAGVIVTGAYLMYLAITLPHWQQRNLKVVAFFELVCPFAFFNAIFIDTPATGGNFALLWVIVSILDGGLYGVIGAILTRLAKRDQRTSTRAGLIASLGAVVVGMIIGAPIWRLICFEIGFGCLIAAWQYNRWSTIPDVEKPSDGGP